jgi:hypothetical protein
MYIGFLVETNIGSFANIGEDRLQSPTKVKVCEDVDTPVRIELPRNIFHKRLYDMYKVCFPINNVDSQCPKENLDCINPIVVLLLAEWIRG